MVSRSVLAVLIVVAAAAGRADEAGDRLMTAFTKVCLARPDSIGAMNALARAQGFAADPSAAAAIADAESNKVDPLNLLIFWRSGAGRSLMKLTGLTAGKADRYEFGCWLDGDSAQPDAILAALKARLGEPVAFGAKGAFSEASWKNADERQGVVTLRYKQGDGARRVSLSVARVLGKSRPR